MAPAASAHDCSPRRDRVRLNLELDSETGRAIMPLPRAMVRDRGMTALVATHDAALLDVADRVVTLRDGRIVGDERPVAAGTLRGRFAAAVACVPSRTARVGVADGQPMTFDPII